MPLAADGGDMIRSITKRSALIALVIVLAAAMLIPPLMMAGMSGGMQTITVSAADGEMRVHFIDCGQADACYIELPDGKSILIDAGENSSESYTAVIDYLDDLGVKTIDWFIMTHSDSDHIGGADEVLENFEIRTIYRPHQEAVGTAANPYEDPAATKSGKYGFYDDVQEKATKVYADALEAAYAETYSENGTTKKAEVYVTNPFDSEINHIEGEAFDYTFDFYSPINVSEYSDSNDYSPIMVLSYASREFVLTGDAEKENEADFVSLVQTASVGDYNGRYDKFIKNEFTADVIKMGHHGSSTSSGEDFLEIMTANAAKRPNIFTIFSCGEENKHGHPHVETLERLMDMGFSAERIERTDLNGNIVFGVTADGALSMSEEKSDVTVAQKLTTGETSTRPQVTVEDNDADPDEAIDELPDTGSADKEDSKLPELLDPDIWARSPLEWDVLQWVIVAIAIIVLVVIIVVSVSRSKKRRRRK